MLAFADSAAPGSDAATGPDYPVAINDALGPVDDDNVDRRSADEISRELANPNSSLASLTFKHQVVFYKGDLPDADDQANYQLVFQPVFPFSVGETPWGGEATFFARPAIPILIDFPAYEAGQAAFDGVTGIGDIGFDVFYGGTERSGFLWGAGVVGALPTATDSRLGSGQFSLGPNLLLAQFNDWGVYGTLLNHRWDILGWGDQYVSVSSGQFFLNFFAEGGWTYGSTPIITYDWRSEEWTIPLNLSVSKTMKLGKMPLKVGLDLNYYVEQPDAFGPEWLIGINVTPVIPNFIEDMFR